MYEVRSTMYDLRNSRALRGDAKRERRDVMEPCAEMVRKGRRRRLAAPMYEVRSTMYDLDYSAPAARGWGAWRRL